MRVVFVHGACVRDGEWWWHRTAELLRAEGVSSQAARLPSCGEADSPADGPSGSGAAFDDDVAAVRAVLSASDEQTVVVGHSYGGMAATQAAAGVGAVRGLVYVSSYLAAPGESMADLLGTEPAPFLVVDEQRGTFSVDPEQLIDTFMHDCPPTLATEALSHLADQDVSVTSTPLTAAAWQEKPSAYVVCALDRGTPAELQRAFAERADRVFEVETGHHPFLADPPAFLSILREVLEQS